MEPIRDNEDFKVCVRNIQNGPQPPKGWFLKKNWNFFLKIMWSSLCLIGLIRFKGTWPDMWGIQNTSSLSHNHEKNCVKTSIFFENHPFWPFWTFLTAQFKSFFVSDWFHKLPCRVRSPEQLKSLPKPLKKCVKAAVSFENHPFYLFGPFLFFFDIPDGSFEILNVSDWFHQVNKVPWHVMNAEHIEYLP